MSMSKDQAIQTVRAMRKQGVTWKAIEKHLGGSGFVSERTGRPIKELAIRYMVDDAEREERIDFKQERQEEALIAVSIDSKFKQNVQALMSVDGFSPELRLELLKVLIEKSHEGKTLVRSPVAKTERNSANL